MFLSKRELEELTDYKTARRQILWLGRHGYKFEIGKNGAPKVLKKHVEQVLGYITSNHMSVVQTPSRRSPLTEPNFAALRRQHG